METQPGDQPETEACKNLPATKPDKKPPPFFVSGIKSVKVFNTLITKLDISPHEMKALANGELKIVLNNPDEYRKMRKALCDIDCLPDTNKKLLGAIKFHTFRLNEDKHYCVFIRGLHHSTDVKDIKDELTLAGHDVINVMNIHIKRKIDDKPTIIKLPLFKVDLKSNDTNQTILDIRQLCHCQISVELPRKKTGVPQCNRCQDYGHTKNYCTKTPRCVKCGERHLYKDCQAQKSSPPKCANCKGNHTSNYRGCPYYQSKFAPNRAAVKTTAVERIKASLQAPAPIKTVNPQRSFASIAASPDLTSTTRGTAAGPSPKASNDNQLDRILSILQRMETSQKNCYRQALCP